MNQQKNKRFNVTELTETQRRELLIECMTRSGFCAFIINQNNQQTHYTFQYKN